MTPQQLIKHFDDSVPFTAYNLAYSEAAIRKWVQLGEVPIRAQMLAEALSGGKVKADKRVKK